jgi:hypothetical protein
MQIHALNACTAQLAKHEVNIVLIAPRLNHPESMAGLVQDIAIRLFRHQYAYPALLLTG